MLSAVRCRPGLASLLVLALAGCAGEPPAPGASETPLAAEVTRAAEVTIVAQDRALPEGADPAPRVTLTLTTREGRTIAREAIAAVRFAGGAAYVANGEAGPTLHAIDAAGAERVLGEEVAGPPVADANGARLAWAEARDLAAPLLRTIGAGDRDPVTIARAPGAMAPLALLGDGSLALVGAANGGVAGLWIAEPRGGGALVCVTNCALRAGTPWGDAYVPPPGDPASIHREGARVSFVAADGSARTATIGDAP